MTKKLSPRMISALRRLAGDESEPSPWVGTLSSLEDRGLIVLERTADAPFHATLTEAGRQRAAEYGAGEVLPPVPQAGAEWWRPEPHLQGRERNDAWARSFSVAWCAGIAAIITAGQILSAFKVEVGDGQWTAFVEHDTPVSLRTAQQLMRIAADHNIARYQRIDTSHDSRRLLPDDRRVLTEICGMEADEFDGLIADGVIHAEMKRGDLKRHRVEAAHGADESAAPAMPGGKYGAILADPPWPFDTYGAGNGRAAEQHYPTMRLDEIAFLRVIERAADDCALFLWTPSHLLHEAPFIMRSWGFTFVSTAFVWVKEGGPGMGYWTRKGAELCLFGTRGAPKRQAADVAEVIRAPRGRHSEKPPEAHDRIERLVAGPYLELFARSPRPGWDVWGNDPALRTTGDPS